MAVDNECEKRLVGDDGTEYMLRETQSVGRSDNCDVVIESPRVSRQHATITLADGDIIVVDDGSSNGTFINGKQIKDPTTLLHGDRVCFDKHCYTFHAAADMLDDPTVVAATPAGEDPTLVSSTPEDGPRKAGSNPVREAEKSSQTGQQDSPGIDTGSLDSLPGSWVDDGTSDQTRIIQPGDLPAASAGAQPLNRAMDGPHLLLQKPATESPAILELTPRGGDEDDIWEIGRESGCEVVIDDAAVSERHAQLVHQGGRWRIVNLVSTNGLFVNDERRLKAYLADGDRIRLGTSLLVFYAAKGSSKPAARRSDTATETDAPTSLRKGLIAAVLLALCVGVAVFLLLF